MAPGSAVAATGRIKLLSLASFGLVSGACFFIGYYLLRRYRKASHRQTDDSSGEEALTTASFGTEHADRIFNQSESREIVCKTGKENDDEEKELKENKKEEYPVQHTNTSTPVVSASGALDAIARGQRETYKDVPISAATTDSFQHDESSVAAAVVDYDTTENKQQQETTADNVNGIEKNEAKKFTTVGQKKGSETRPVAAPNKVQTDADGGKVFSKEETGSEAFTAAGKQPEKVSEITSVESTTEKSSSSNRNETKPPKATSETIGHPKTSDTFNGSAESKTPKHIKAADVGLYISTDKGPTSETTKVVETTPVELEVRAEGDHTESADTADDRAHKSEFPRSGKSHIPEPIRRLADDRHADVSQEAVINRKAEPKTPVTSPKGKDAARPVWSEQPDLKEIRQSSEGGIAKVLQPLNKSTSLRPNEPHLVDGAEQELTSTGKNKAGPTTETHTVADKEGVDGAASALSDSPRPESDDSSPSLVVRSNKYLVPLPPLTPPPDTNKQSRRQRGLRGSQKTATPTEPPAADENQSRRSRHRWPPLEDKALDRVEVDTSSQQASWKTNKKPSSAQSSPWSSPPHDAVQEEPSSSHDRRKILFDDNFVDPVSPKVLSPTEKSELIVPRDVTKQSSLLSATPDCVLERKPLISEDDDDDDDADDDGEGVKKQFVGKNSAKNGNEDVTTEPKGEEPNSNEDAAKLVEIDQNCIGSLIGLAGEKADPDVRLASLRALVNLSWASEKHQEFPPVLDQLYANIDKDDDSVKLESLHVLVNLSKNPAMVPHLLAAKAPINLLKLLVPEISEEVLINWLTILDDILWTSKELCLTFASLPTEHRAASPETLYTGLYGLKNSRILKSRIFVLSRHKSQQVTYLASRIYSCLTS